MALSPEDAGELQEMMRKFVLGELTDADTEVLDRLKEKARQEIGMSTEDSDFITLVHRWMSEFEHDGVELHDLFGMTPQGFKMYMRIVEDFGNQEPTIATDVDKQAIWSMGFTMGMLAQRYVDQEAPDA